MTPFATDHDESNRGDRGAPREDLCSKSSANSAVSAVAFTQALRRCRHLVPARVAVDDGGRPARATTDRRGFAGGSVVACGGPWRTSGDWLGGAAGPRGGGARGKTPPAPPP